jgi:hypothetical protein
MFADPYFEKAGRFRPRIPGAPDEATTLAVIIPCMAEPELLQTLQSLLDCDPVPGKAEVIVLINEPENGPAEISALNLDTSAAARKWVISHEPEWLKFHIVGPVRLPAKWAGVGLARKTAMDEALSRFNRLDRPDGIIISLDADTLVERNYFRAIRDHFLLHPGDVGATIRFSHQTEEFPARQQQGIRIYEQYLFYFREALRFTGYPHAIYTVGSAFAVTARAYMKRGGMTRRKAGEDFYFLQTLTQLGKVGEITATCVYPSARVSQRVPFGTGPFMKKWMEKTDNEFLTYNFQAFRDLKLLFGHRSRLFRTETGEPETLVNALPEPVRAYLQQENLMTEIGELARNCRQAETFNERFFQIFNAFRILKFLNFAHPGFYEKSSLESCLTELEMKNDIITG